MEFFETLAARHSIRRFTKQQVAKQQIETILRAALSAPSSKNARSSYFIVITDIELLQKIAAMRDYGSAFIADAPAAIIVLGDTATSDLWVDNAAISATFIQLAATTLGLASCWVHVNGRQRVKDALPPTELASDYLRTIVDMPAYLAPLCIIALGYPVPDQNIVPRIDIYAERVVFK